MAAQTRHTVDTSLIKRGHSKVTYDAYKLKELKKCLVDPVYFLENYMKIQHPVRGGIPFDPYDFQRELINCYAKHRMVIALLPRQVGKCVKGDTLIKIRNKITGEIKEITIEEFFNLVKGDKTE